MSTREENRGIFGNCGRDSEFGRSMCPMREAIPKEVPCHAAHTMPNLDEESYMLDKA